LARISSVLVVYCHWSLSSQMKYQVLLATSIAPSIALMSPSHFVSNLFLTEVGVALHHHNISKCVDAQAILAFFIKKLRLVPFRHFLYGCLLLVCALVLIRRLLLPYLPTLGLVQLLCSGQKWMGGADAVFSCAFFHPETKCGVEIPTSNLSSPGATRESDLRRISAYLSIPGLLSSSPTISLNSNAHVPQH
jgi:hypothetical protein